MELTPAGLSRLRELGSRRKAMKLSALASGSPYDRAAMQSQRRADKVVACLRRYGMAVIDNFLGSAAAQYLRLQCESVPLSPDSADGAALSSRILTAWVHESEPSSDWMARLLTPLDKLIKEVELRLNWHRIDGRTAVVIDFKIGIEPLQAMISCYPGNGAHCARHVDNCHGDGRLLTCAYYLNHSWNSHQDGGVLQLHPTAATEVGGNMAASVSPQLDRLVVFWSDFRTPHQVLPSHRHRYGVTVWYYDDEERRQALNRTAGGRKANPSPPARLAGDSPILSPAALVESVATTSHPVRVTLDQQALNLSKVADAAAEEV